MVVEINPLDLKEFKMQIDGFRRFLPYAGILCMISLVAAFVLGGTTPQDGSTASEFLNYYKDNQTAHILSNFVFANLFSVFLLMFATEIRATLRSGEAGESIYASLAYAGAIATAVAISVGGMISVAAGSAANDGFSAATLALGELAAYSFIPWMVGAAALFLAVGIGGLKTATLPKWLSWITVVMGVLCFTPGGIAVFMFQPVWFVLAAVVLVRRQTASAKVSNSSGATQQSAPVPAT
jgi:hypothetical protein